MNILTKEASAYFERTGDCAVDDTIVVVDTLKGLMSAVLVTNKNTGNSWYKCIGPCMLEYSNNKERV